MKPELTAETDWIQTWLQCVVTVNDFIIWNIRHTNIRQTLHHFLHTRTASSHQGAPRLCFTTKSCDVSLVDLCSVCSHLPHSPTPVQRGWRPAGWRASPPSSIPAQFLWTKYCSSVRRIYWSQLPDRRWCHCFPVCRISVCNRSLKKEKHIRTLGHH